jgi:hypothetical protein
MHTSDNFGSYASYIQKEKPVPHLVNCGYFRDSASARRQKPKSSRLRAKSAPQKSASYDDEKFESDEPGEELTSSNRIEYELEYILVVAAFNVISNLPLTFRIITGKSYGKT